MESTYQTPPSTPARIPLSPGFSDDESFAFPSFSLSCDDLSPKGVDKMKSLLKIDELDEETLKAFTRLVIYEDKALTLDYFKLKEEEILYSYNKNAANHNGIKGDAGEAALQQFLQEVFANIVDKRNYRIFIESKVQIQKIVDDSNSKTQEIDVLVATSNKKVLVRELLASKCYPVTICRCAIQVKTPLRSRDIQRSINNLATVGESIPRIIFASDAINSGGTAFNFKTVKNWLNKLDTNVDGLFILCNKEKSPDKYGVVAISRRLRFTEELISIMNARTEEKAFLDTDKWLIIDVDQTRGYVLAVLFLVILYATPSEHRIEVNVKQLVEKLSTLHWV
eukprot:TRINITY_DN2166_c0_g1_i1.p1 TRINITY_DN2166_c0_g1~~TRINITY_DN2166_c0_g1_i1.p1  ORF type:complete len:349 (-),score=-13.21 TRINITY_DN2166_c0_g1_i1:92-1105(-)